MRPIDKVHKKKVEEFRAKTLVSRTKRKMKKESKKFAWIKKGNKTTFFGRFNNLLVPLP